MNFNQSVTIVYDLAMTMAGETQPRQLAIAMFQRLLAHTGCACGAVLLDPCPVGGDAVSVDVYAVVGSRTLCSLEGTRVEWPAGLLRNGAVRTEQGWLPGARQYAHALNLMLPDVGQVLLLSAHDTAEIGSLAAALFPQVLAKFARSLRLCLDDQAHRASLIRAKELAEACSQAKSRFLSSMSHELRTPLNAILGYTQLLEMDDDLSEEVLGNIREIGRAGHCLLAMVNDVLDLGRIEAGEMDLLIETFALADVVARSRAENLAAAESRRIAFDEAHCDAALHVSADRRRLRQALNNLVSNAIKFNREGGRVTISCAATDDGRIRITVTDNGPGIAADLQAQLFQPFNRLGGEMGPVEGSGIGLAIARQLMVSMSGAIGYKDEIGGGCFWLEIPSAGVEKMPSAVIQPRDDRPAVARRLQDARVLVVEDYQPNQQVFAMQLERLGCIADIAPHGAAALEKWSANRYGLILTDINMPVMDGLDLARAVRRREQASGGHIPIIAITAAAVSSERTRCREAGMDDVLTKPLSLEQLRGCLTRWLGPLAAAPDQAAASPRAPLPAATALKDAPILDLVRLYDVLGQVSLDAARDLVATFLGSAREGLDRLASGGEEVDNAAVSREMHKQKSSARTVGALRYAQRAESLELQAKAGGTIGLTALRQDLADVEAAAARLDAAIPTDAAELPPIGHVAEVFYASVLVVDDDVVVQRQMSATLSRLGVKEVLLADHGEQALALIEARSDAVAAVICDLDMPRMDGVELIRLLGHIGFQGGLILMSGADEQVLKTVSNLARLHGLQLLGHLQKPVMPAQIAALLATVKASPVQRPRFNAGPGILLQDLRAAMANNEFSMWFQPKVEALTLRPIGVEALARWRRPDGHFVPPDVFITLAEQEGIIGELSRILVSLALKEGARLHVAGFPLKVAVNLSGRWLDDLSLPEFIQNTVLAAGLKSADIVLEVTETGVMKELAKALDVLTRLRLKGFGLSIDDFGIGYSSFEQLGRIPFTELKLDRSFVVKGGKDVAARAILESSMSMARKLGLSTVAEGVETLADLELVRSLICDAVQGYLIAKPMPPDELIDWLRGWQDKKSPL